MTPASWFWASSITESAFSNKTWCRYPPGTGLFPDIRNQLLIALAPPPAFRVTVMVLATGVEIDSIFGVSPTKTIKYQFGISRQGREEHAGQMLDSGVPFGG